MSNRRKSKPVINPMLSYLAGFSGHQTPGGCDDCNAYQTVTVDGPVAAIRVHHDRTCPWLNGVTR